MPNSLNLTGHPRLSPFYRVTFLALAPTWLLGINEAPPDPCQWEAPEIVVSTLQNPISMLTSTKVVTGPPAPDRTENPGGLNFMIENAWINSNRVGYPGFNAPVDGQPATRYQVAMQELSTTVRETLNGREHVCGSYSESIRRGMSLGALTETVVSRLVNPNPLWVDGPVVSDTQRKSGGPADDVKLTHTLSVPHTVAAFVSSTIAHDPFNGTFPHLAISSPYYSLNGNQTNLRIGMTRIKWRWGSTMTTETRTAPPVCVVKYSPPDDPSTSAVNESLQTEVVKTYFWENWQTEQESPVYEINPLTLKGQKNGTYTVSLLPFDIEKASLSEGQFVVNIPDISSGASGTFDLVFKKQGGGEIIARTIQNQAPGKVTIALDEILTGAANTPSKPFDNQDAAKCDKIYARWRVGTIDVKTGDRSFDDVQISGQTKKVAAVEVLAKRKISNYFSPEWSGTWGGTVRSKGTYRAGEWPASLTNIDVAGKLLDALDPANEGLAMDGTTVIRDRYRPAQDGHPQVTALNGAASIQNEADTQGYPTGYICKPDVDQDNASSPQVTLLRPTSVAVRTNADRLTYNDVVYIPDIPDVHLRTVDDAGELHDNTNQIDVWRGQGDETLANQVRTYFKPASTCLKIFPVATP